MAWAIELRELTAQDLGELAGMGELPCGWKGCGRNASWEAIEEGLLNRNAVFQLSQPSNLREPDSELWAEKTHRYYCEEHAKQFCRQGNLDLPTKLAARSNPTD